MVRLHGTLTPFLYPSVEAHRPISRKFFRSIVKDNARRHQATAIFPHTASVDAFNEANINDDVVSSESSRNVFADKATVTLRAGAGGNGCISFLREKYLEHGPANGGDGGIGGSIYIQAIRGETSLHKLARRQVIKAGKGQNGKGKSKGGQRGDDVLIQVPVGTIVKEFSRHDPVAEEDTKEFADGEHEVEDENRRGTWRRDKWLLYAAASPSDYATMDFPRLPRRRRSHLAPSQPAAPISLDLSQPMEKPVLLAAGAVGGLGNPHFLSRSMPRPKLATKGDMGTTLTLELELKLLADLGFVGMPNAGKSTLLRAMSRSRARVGDWAFTTLSPNIGTMVLDDHKGRPMVKATEASGEPRTQISIADIPGLVEDAHLDKGLGLGFLRHIERAKVLAFVVDLSSGDAVEALKNLWVELSQFEKLRGMDTNQQTESRVSDWEPVDGMDASLPGQHEKKTILSPSIKSKPSDLPMAPISTKPWFVVATKADVDGTQQNFAHLQAYLLAVNDGAIEHPCRLRNAWKGTLAAIPVSAIRGEGIKHIPEWTVALLAG